SLSAKPTPRVVAKRVDEVAERRAQKRRRNFYMVAAAGALIVSGPFVAGAANGGGESGSGGGGTNRTLSADPATDVFEQIPDKLTATDP
ncbi:RNA polymerase subunit sigma, partial [Streptomyces prasinus]